jgi:large repetitive protein
VASDSAGNFVVTWESEYQDGNLEGVFGKRYGSAGEPLGPEFRVNTQTSSAEVDPSVAADASGRFVVVWQSFIKDGSSYGIFAQRFGPIVPVELMGVGVE